MIFKTDLLDMIKDLNHDLLLLSKQVDGLKAELKRQKSETCKCKETKANKTAKATTSSKRRGRPAESKNKK